MNFCLFWLQDVVLVKHVITLLGVLLWAVFYFIFRWMINFITTMNASFESLILISPKQHSILELKINKYIDFATSIAWKYSKKTSKKTYTLVIFFSNYIFYYCTCAILPFFVPPCLNLYLAWYFWVPCMIQHLNKSKSIKTKNFIYFPSLNIRFNFLRNFTFSY